MTALRAHHARVAYDALAPGYDALTAHHEHAGWTGLLLDLARAAGVRGKRLLDVGCGTGNTMLPMLERGFSVTGADVSPAMLEAAERKLEGRARLVAADMRELPGLGAFDLVWSLGDALNYLQSEAELAQALDGFRRNLAPGGVVLFDVNTLATFRRLYSSIFVVPGPERVIVLDGQGDAKLPAGGAAVAWIDRLEPGPDGWWTRVRSVHHHRHHPPQTVRAALAAAGLELRSVMGVSVAGAVESPLDDLAHSKAVYTASERR